MLHLYQGIISLHQAQQCKKLRAHLDQEYHEKRVDPDDVQLSAFHQSFTRIQDQAEYKSIIMTRNEQISLKERLISETNINPLDRQQPEHNSVIHPRIHNNNLAHSYLNQLGRWYKRHWVAIALTLALTGLAGTAPLYISGLIILGSIYVSIGIYAGGGLLSALLFIGIIKILCKYCCSSAKPQVRVSDASALFEATQDEQPSLIPVKHSSTTLHQHEDSKEHDAGRTSDEKSATHVTQPQQGSKAISNVHTGGQDNRSLLTDVRSSIIVKTDQPSEEKSSQITTDKLNGADSNDTRYSLSINNNPQKRKGLKMQENLIEILRDININVPLVLITLINDYRLAILTIHDLLEAQTSFPAQQWRQSFAAMSLQAPNNLRKLLQRSVGTVTSTEKQTLISVISNDFQEFIEYQPRFPVLRAVGWSLMIEKPQVFIQFIQAIVEHFKSNPSLIQFEKVLQLIKNLNPEMMPQKSHIKIATDLVRAAEKAGLFMQQIEPETTAKSKKAYADLCRVERLLMYCLHHLGQFELVQDKTFHVVQDRYEKPWDDFEGAVQCNIIEEKQMEDIQKALNQGVDVNGLKFSMGHSPLMCAAFFGHTEIVQLFLQYNTQIDLQTNTGETALMQAAAEGHTKTAQLLLEHDADIDAQDETGQSALIKAAAAAGHIAMIYLLLDWGADRNLPATDGSTVFTQAFYNDHKDIAEFLLKNGVKVDRQNHHIREALGKAICENNNEIVQCLREQGVQLDPDGHYGNMLLKSGHQDMVLPHTSAINTANSYNVPFFQPKFMANRIGQASYQRSSASFYPDHASIIVDGEFKIDHALAENTLKDNEHMMPPHHKIPLSDPRASNPYSPITFISSDRGSPFAKPRSPLYRAPHHASKRRDENNYLPPLSNNPFTGN